MIRVQDGSCKNADPPALLLALFEFNISFLSSILRYVPGISVEILHLVTANSNPSYDRYSINFCLWYYRILN